MARSVERNWAELPSELLGSIVDKVLLPDFIRFGAVCKPWLSVTIDKHETRSRNCCKEPPMLFFPPWWNREHDDGFDERLLYNISECNAYTHRFRLPSSNHVYSKCKSSLGWWIICRDDLSVELRNPFSNESIILPSLSEPGHLYDYQFKVKRVLLSSSPSLHPNDWVAAAIGGLDGVSLISSGNLLSWTTYYDFRITTCIQDACFYMGGLLYVLDFYCRLFVINYSSGQELPPSGSTSNKEHGWKAMRAKDENGDIKITAGIVKIRRLISEFGSSLDVLVRRECYLVVMEGDLLMVVGKKWKVRWAFSVFRCSHKLESITGDEKEDESEGEWIEIKDLGKYSLFVGMNQSMCICATDFPNCKPNCIYYTAANVPWAEICDNDWFGVFDLNPPPAATNSEDGNSPPSQSSYITNPPVWISPTLQKIQR